jgi:tripartite-type tricarboxylate transporter receptor subunit TctC
MASPPVARMSETKCGIPGFRGCAAHPGYTSLASRFTLLILVIGVALFCAPAPAAAQYPQRPVAIVVPFPAGGATDLIARLLASELQAKLGQPFVVESRPGAGTTLAATAVARAAPDGSTLLLATTSTLAIAPSVYKTLAYDPLKDFAPVELVGTTDFVLISDASLPAVDLPALIALLRTKAGAMTYASAGIGTPHHLIMAMFLREAGATAQHVPYRGSPAALTDIVAGRVPLMMCDLTAALPLIRAGKLKAFGVATATRSPQAPDIPTIAEAGLPGFAASGWFSIVAPAGTPPGVVDTLNRIMSAYLVRPEAAEKLAAAAMRPLTSTPEELARFIVSERAKWADVAAAAGIEPQ